MLWPTARLALPAHRLRHSPPLMSAGAEWELPPSWAVPLRAELRLPYYAALRAFVDSERESAQVLPAAEQQFAALSACAFDDVR